MVEKKRTSNSQEAIYFECNIKNLQMKKERYWRYAQLNMHRRSNGTTQL